MENKTAKKKNYKRIKGRFMDLVDRDTYGYRIVCANCDVEITEWSPGKVNNSWEKHFCGKKIEVKK